MRFFKICSTPSSDRQPLLVSADQSPSCSERAKALMLQGSDALSDGAAGAGNITFAVNFMLNAMQRATPLPLTIILAASGMVIMLPFSTIPRLRKEAGAEPTQNEAHVVAALETSLMISYNASFANDLFALLGEAYTRNPCAFIDPSNAVYIAAIIVPTLVLTIPNMLTGVNEHLKSEDELVGALAKNNLLLRAIQTSGLGQQKKTALTHLLSGLTGFGARLSDASIYNALFYMVQSLFYDESAILCAFPRGVRLLVPLVFVSLYWAMSGCLSEKVKKTYEWTTNVPALTIANVGSIYQLVVQISGADPVKSTLIYSAMMMTYTLLTFYAKSRIEPVSADNSNAAFAINSSEGDEVPTNADTAGNQEDLEAGRRVGCGC